MNRKYLLAAFMIASALIGTLIVAPDGSTLFRDEGCLGCHRFRGKGGSAGPDLSAVGARRGSVWIARQIGNPKMHNPDSRMPAFSNLTFFERYAIARYLTGTEEAR